MPGWLLPPLRGSIPIDEVLLLLHELLPLLQVVLLALLLQCYVLADGLLQILEHVSLRRRDQVVVRLHVVVLAHLLQFVEPDLFKLQVGLVHAFELDTTRDLLVLEHVERNRRERNLRSGGLALVGFRTSLASVSISLCHFGRLLLLLSDLVFRRSSTFFKVWICVFFVLFLAAEVFDQLLHLLVVSDNPLVAIRTLHDVFLVELVLVHHYYLVLDAVWNLDWLLSSTCLLRHNAAWSFTLSDIVLFEY